MNRPTPTTAKAITLFILIVTTLTTLTAEAQLDYSKYGRKGAKARKRWLTEYPKKAYAPTTPAYCDALWMRVHEANCPMLLLKEKKKVITLAQADKEGWRIGETGQSGRGRCCFQGYRRMYPEKDFTEDSPGIVQYMKDGTRLKWHQAGCHRFNVAAEPMLMTQREAKARADAEGLELFYVCIHCIERGPGRAAVDMEAMGNRPATPAFTPPAGWSPTSFSPDQLPSKEEVNVLIQEALSKGYGIQEAAYEDPVASAEEFMGRRFFFPVDNWLTFYQAYRGSGDKRILEALRVSARHYRDLCNEYPEAAQLKARDPEGMAFMYSMAVSSRITLQLARKYPDQVSEQEIEEAISFLKAIVFTLRPTVEGYNVDPQMGIPVPLAEDFKTRAFNRALNGIGTLAMTTAALEDLKAMQNLHSLQPQITRYKQCIQAYFNNWIKMGSLTMEDGKSYFYYPYNTQGKLTRRQGLLIGRADDTGHYSHSVQGVMLVHDATPELGADDAFMTAMANAVLFTSTTKNGSVQSPAAAKIKPVSRKKWSRDPKNRLYMFEAFTDGVIDGQNSHISGDKKEEINSGFAYRLKTLHAHYLKALRKDRRLVHLGEVM